MKLSENPFYKLSISMEADKNAISEASDDLCFDYPEREDEFEEARNILINPQKRIAAEVRWFPGVGGEQEEKLVRSFQQSKGGLETYPNDLVKMNCLIYSLAYQTDDKFVSNIIEIDKLYSRISLPEITAWLNEARPKAGIPLIQNADTLQGEWDGRKDDIREVIQEVTRGIRREKYTRLANEIIEITYRAKEHGAVIEEFFTNYQMDMHPFVVEEKEKINELIDSINNKGNISKIKALEIELRLIAPVLKPLNMMYLSMGLRNYGETGNIYFPVHDLAVDLYKEKNDANSSFKLIEILKNLFGYIPELKEQLEDDYGFLKKEIGSPLFNEANKALRDIIEEMNNKLFYEEGHREEIFNFYKNEFLNCYKKIIKEFVGRNGYSYDELTRLNESAAIIYKDMANSMTWTDDFETAYDLICQALSYARKANNQEYIDAIEEQKASIKRSVDCRKEEAYNNNYSTSSASSKQDDSGLGGCFVMLVCGAVGAAIGGPIGGFIGLWLGAKISD